MQRLAVIFLAIVAINADKIPLTDAETTAPTATTTTTTTTTTDLHTTIDSVNGTTTEASPPASEISCKRLRSGPHAIALCSQEYISCWRGKKYARKCDDDFFYHGNHKTCDFKYNIPYCYPNPFDHPRFSIISVPASYDKYCQDKPNGFYGTGCNTYFYSCSEGHTFRLSCPGELFFDDDKTLCTRKEKILACEP